MIRPYGNYDWRDFANDVREGYRMYRWWSDHGESQNSQVANYKRKRLDPPEDDSVAFDSSSGLMGGVKTSDVGVGKVWRSRKESRGHRYRRMKLVRDATRAALLVAPVSDFTRVAQVGVVTAAANVQTLYVPNPLHSFMGDTATLNDDIWDIASLFASAKGIDPNFTVYESKLHLTHAVQRTEVVNNETFSVYVDCYQYIARRNLDYTGVSSIISTGTNVDEALGGGGGGTLGSNINYTPFQIQGFVSQCKILSKKTFLIEAGRSISYDMFGRTGLLDMTCSNGITAGTIVGLGGWTKGQLFMLCNQAALANSAAASVSGVTIVTRNYYKAKWIPNDQRNENTAQNMI